MTRSRLAFVYAALALLIVETVAAVMLFLIASPMIGGLSLRHDTWDVPLGVRIASVVGVSAVLNMWAVKAVSRMGMAGERTGRRRLALAGAAVVQLGLAALGLRHENTPAVLYPVVVLLLLAALCGRLASDAGVRG
ncbi:hypothetical protein ACGF13_18665 [Kitasatospora sp. NPDC048286]|uniref:hypothetical protein n=1 Tax=Kitasatospora sp. NPDC048286 TaxID=3364047 RepID=UPI0037202DD2